MRRDLSKYLDEFEKESSAFLKRVTDSEKFFVIVWWCWLLWMFPKKKFGLLFLPWNCLFSGMRCSMVYALIYLSRIFLGASSTAGVRINQKKEDNYSWLFWALILLTHYNLKAFGFSKKQAIDQFANLRHVLFSAWFTIEVGDHHTLRENGMFLTFAKLHQFWLFEQVCSSSKPLFCSQYAHHPLLVVRKDHLKQKTLMVLAELFLSAVYYQSTY